MPPGRADNSQHPAFLHDHFLVVQVVRHGYHEKQDDQGAAHRNDLLLVTGTPRRVFAAARKFASQQGDSENRQDQPDEIERQFHISKLWYAFRTKGARSIPCTLRLS